MQEKINFYSYGKDKPALTERIRGIKEPAHIVRGQAFPRNIQDLREGKRGLFAEVIGREATVEEARLRVSELVKEGGLFYSPDTNGNIPSGIKVLSAGGYERVSQINDWVERLLVSGRAQSQAEALTIIQEEVDTAINAARERIDMIFRERFPFGGISSRRKKSA